jgi:hypothetical protein
MGGEVSLTLEMNPLINKNLLWLLHPKNCRSGTCEKQNKQKKEDNNFTWFGYKRLHPQSLFYFSILQYKSLWQGLVYIHNLGEDNP